MFYMHKYKLAFTILTYLLTYLLAYLLTPWSRVLLEKLTGFAACQETFYYTLYHNCTYNLLPEDEPSGSKHVEDIIN